MSDDVIEICSEFYAKLPIKIRNFLIDTDGKGGLEISETVTVSKKIATKKEKPPSKYAAEIEHIVAYLNEVCGTKFRTSSKKTQTIITARLDEGYYVEDLKKVIDTKNYYWKDNEKMRSYLRPETLFGNKFEGYLNEKIVEVVINTQEHSYDLDKILTQSMCKY